MRGSIKTGAGGASETLPPAKRVLSHHRPVASRAVYRIRVGRSWVLVPRWFAMRVWRPLPGAALSVAWGWPRGRVIERTSIPKSQEHEQHLEKCTCGEDWPCPKSQDQPQANRG